MTDLLLLRHVDFLHFFELVPHSFQLALVLAFPILTNLINQLYLPPKLIPLHPNPLNNPIRLSLISLISNLFKLQQSLLLNF